MSRDIKFRAWDSSAGRMLYRTLFDRNWYATEKPTKTGCNCVQGIKPRDCHMPTMQYTGLKDKNGVDIYESDIVRHTRLVTFCDDYHTGEPSGVDTLYVRTGKIAWNPSWGIHLVGKQTVTDYNDCKILHDNVKWRGPLRCWGEMAEVLGNIHQHPHLLP